MRLLHALVNTADGAYPGVPDPLVELNVALGGLGLEIGGDISKTKSHGGRRGWAMRGEMGAKERWEES